MYPVVSLDKTWSHFVFSRDHLAVDIVFERESTIEGLMSRLASHPGNGGRGSSNTVELPVSRHHREHDQVSAYETCLPT